MKMHLKAVDLAIISVFCALFVALNFSLGPLGFALFRLPILHDFAVFFTILLATWATGKFGVASAVGVIGSITVLLIRFAPLQIGFIVSALVFDIIMSANHHKIYTKTYNLIITTLASAVSAYTAGVIIGIFFMPTPSNTATLQWALITWGGWHSIGGIITAAITLPIIGILEKTNIRRIIGAQS